MTFGPSGRGSEGSGNRLSSHSHYSHISTRQYATHSQDINRTKVNVIRRK